MNHSDRPLVAGGQGHDPQAVEASGWWTGLVFVALVVLVVVGLVVNL